MKSPKRCSRPETGRATVGGAQDAQHNPELTVNGIRCLLGLKLPKTGKTVPMTAIEVRQMSAWPI